MLFHDWKAVSAEGTRLLSKSGWGLGRRPQFWRNFALCGCGRGYRTNASSAELRAGRRALRGGCRGTPSTAAKRAEEEGAGTATPSLYTHTEGGGTPRPPLSRGRRNPAGSRRLGVLTAAQCCGGCSSGRRAAPARDSPPCFLSRSTAPGTAAAPPRPPAPAAAPGPGGASPRRTSSPPAAPGRGPPASGPGRRGARRPPLPPRRGERSGNFQGAEKAKSSLSRAEPSKQARQSTAGGNDPQLKATWRGGGLAGPSLRNPSDGGDGRHSALGFSSAGSFACSSPSRDSPRIRPGAASAPTRVPAAGRSQPPGAAAGLHRAHTALPRGSANHPPLAGIHQTVSRKEEGGETKKKKKVKHTR